MTFIVNNTYILDFDKEEVLNITSGRCMALGSNEVNLLRYMIEHPNVILSKAELMKKVWFDKGIVVEESSLMHTISSCRKAFEDKQGNVISTKRGEGYVFIANITTQQAPTEDSPALFNKRFITVNTGIVILSAILTLLSLGYFNTSHSQPEGLSVSSFSQCTLQLKNSARVYTKVTQYKLNKQSLLVADNGNSLSYFDDQMEVLCE